MSTSNAAPEEEYVIPSSENLGFDPYAEVDAAAIEEKYGTQAPAPAQTYITPPVIPVIPPPAPVPDPTYSFEFGTAEPASIPMPSTPPPSPPATAPAPPADWTAGVSSGIVNAEKQELANMGYTTPAAQQAAMDALAQVPSYTGSLSSTPGSVNVAEAIVGAGLGLIPGAGNAIQDAFINAVSQPTLTRDYVDATGNVVQSAPIDSAGLSPDAGTAGGFTPEMGDTPREDIAGYQSATDVVASTPTPTPAPAPTEINTEGGAPVGTGNAASSFTMRPVIDLTAGYNALNETPGARDVNWYRSQPFYQQLTAQGGLMNPETALSGADAYNALAGGMLGQAAQQFVMNDPTLAAALQAFQSAQAGAQGQAGIGQQALGAMNQGVAGLGTAQGYLQQAAQGVNAGQGTLAGALSQLTGARQAAQVGGQQQLGQGLFNQGAQLAQEQAQAARQGQMQGQQALTQYQQAAARSPQQQYGSFLGAQQQMLGQAGAAADAATSVFGQSAMAQAAQQSDQARRAMEQRLATSGLMGTQSGAALGAITEAASRPYAEALTNIAAQRSQAFQGAYNPQAQALLGNTLAAPERQLAGLQAGQQIASQGVQGLGSAAQSLFGAGQGVLSAGQLGLGQAGALGQLAGQQAQIGQAQGAAADRLTQIGQAQGGLSGQYGQLGQGMLGAGQLGLSIADMQRLAGQGMLSQAQVQQGQAQGLAGLGGQYAGLGQLAQQRGLTLADILNQQSQQALVAPKFQQGQSQEDKLLNFAGAGGDFLGNLLGNLFR